MCYRCGLCQSVVPPRQPRRVHVVTRLVPANVQRIGTALPYGQGGWSRPIEVRHPEREEIAREIPVCGSCQSALANGVPMVALERSRLGRSVRGYQRMAPMQPANLASRPSVGYTNPVPLEEPSETERPKLNTRPETTVPVTLGGRVVRRKERS